MLPSMGGRAGAGAKEDPEGSFTLPFFPHEGRCFVHFRSGKQVDACECLEYALGLERLR